MNLRDLNIDSNWTLFLDRDGVINRRLIDDYVKRVEDFEFLPDVLQSISGLSTLFGRIVVVTNQQGIGKGLMTEADVNLIHSFLMDKVKGAGGRIDSVLFAPNLEEENSQMRKPNIGMAQKAQEDFPEIVFEKCLMVGDSVSDMQFGKNAKMVTVMVGAQSAESSPLADFSFDTLFEFSNYLLASE